MTVADFTVAGQQQVLNLNALGIKVTVTLATFNNGITGAKMVDTGTNPLKAATLTVSGSGSATYRVGSETTD